MSAKKKHIFTGAGIGAAFTWFTSHCGSGFATGRQLMQYYGRHGWWSLILPLFTWAVVGLAYYFAMEFCRRKEIYNYKDFGREFYWPKHGRIFVVLMDWVMILGNITGIASSIAAGGQIITRYLHIPHYNSILIMMVAITLIITYGLKLIMGFSSVLGITIVGILVVVILAGLRVGGGEVLRTNLNALACETSAAAAWKDAVTYIGMRMTTIGTLVVLLKGMTKQDVKVAVCFGAGINALAIAGVCLMLLNFYPAIVEETLPILTVLDMSGMNGLEIFYNLMLFCAVITTALSLTLGLVARFVPYGTKWVKSENRRHALYTGIIILVSLGISSFGLTTIVKTGYNVVGNLALVIFTIPWLILGPIRLKQIKEE